jgi:hypothetical protein
MLPGRCLLPFLCTVAACRFDPAGLPGQLVEARTADRPADRAAERAATDQAADRAADRIADRAADRAADRVADTQSPDLAPPCGGQRLGGHCFYLGAWGESCDQACLTHGGCDLAGTRDYAGSAGTDGQCVAALGALGQAGAPHQAYSNNPYGCQLCWPSTPYTYWSPGVGITPTPCVYPSCETDCSGSAGICRRVCACNK